MDPRLSSALEGGYTIDREIGAGGMATMYLAHDRKHDRQVAVKVLRPELAAAMGSERFPREIRIVASFNHPHILWLYDSGETEGFLYYVMPYVDGESLRDRLLRDKQLPVNESIRILHEVADALAYSHTRGVVHRDIKPGNILLSGRHAVVTDFGVAKALTAAGEGGRIWYEVVCCPAQRHAARGAAHCHCRVPRPVFRSNVAQRVMSPSYVVSVQPAQPRGIAAVTARVPKGSVAAVFRTYLDHVYAAGRTDAIPLDGQNIFVYRGVEGSPNELDVDFGVGVRAPFSAVGEVRYTEVPSGQVATTTHVGDYAVGAAHAAILAWCNAHDLRLAGPSWEVYGHSSPDKPPRTDIYYLLAP